MANITVKDLTIDNNREDVNLLSFVRDLSEEQLNLRGGIDVTSDGEPIRQPHCDVIINFPRKFPGKR
jgi:hypothetical protein